MKKTITLIISLFLILFTLTACSNKASTETSIPDNNSQELESSNLEIITQNEKLFFTFNDISKINQESFISKHTNSAGVISEVSVKGVSIEQLLLDKDVVLSNISSVILTASDGYVIEIKTDEYSDNGLYILSEYNGEPLSAPQSCVPNARSMYWVRDLIKIEFVSIPKEDNSTSSINPENDLTLYPEDFESKLTALNENTLTSNSILITGDVKNELLLNDFTSFPVQITEINSQEISSVYVFDILKLAGLYTNDSSILFYSNDGVMAEIPAAELNTDCQLIQTKENNWQLIAPNHPPQAGMRHISKIIVISNTITDNQPYLSINNADNQIQISYGNLFKEDAIISSVLEGSAEKFENSVNAYTKKELIPISNYINDGSAIIAKFEDGREIEISQSGFLEWRGTSADYIAPDKKERIANITNIWTKVD